MRQFERDPDEFPVDPEIRAELDAIDATLSGRIVDPEYAELAELAVLIAAERPKLAPASAQTIDERVLWRLGPSAPRPPRRKGRRLHAQWAVGASMVAATVVALVVLVGHGGGSSGPAQLNATSAPAHRSSSRGATSTAAAGSAATSSPAQASAKSTATGNPTSPSASSSPAYQSSLGASHTGSTAPAPTPSARKTIQSAQLALAAPTRWVDVVAQEVFDVVGQEKGIVRSSQVTAAAGSKGYATFDLSIPSSSLADTVTRLSALQHSQVTSRTDGTQDVNGQYLSDQRRLGDARALRISLLRQLAAATTQTQIASLKAQIRSAEATINAAQSTLHQLQYQTGFSHLNVTINSGPYLTPLPLAGAQSGGGFTIGHAAHDALNVLTVAAGVALIALAALVPLGLLVALWVWVAHTLRRRRREHALDAA